MKEKSRYKISRRFLIFWTLFIGLGAVAGATGMLCDPSGKAMGMDAMLPYFKVLPFSDILFCDFVFSGVALLIVNGITNLTAAGLLFAKKETGVVLGGLFGVTLMLWICIQFYMFPLNFMSTIYFIFGLCQAVTGFVTWVFNKQETFKVNEADYRNIGTNKNRIVVYFSRMGYTKKIAFEEADKTGAEILEIKSAEKTDGTAGFWWCGRFGLHRWGMPILPIEKDLSKYDSVTVCSPIWVFNLSAPIRTFLKEQVGIIKKIDLITVHFNKSAYKNAIEEIENQIGIKVNRFTDICSRFGKIKKKTIF